MKPRSIFLHSFCLLFFPISFTGCGGGGSDTSTDENKTASKGTIGVSVLTLGNPFFSVIANSITEEAAKHGYEVIVVDGNRNVQKQANQIDDFLTKGVAAIVLNPCDRISTGAAIKKACDAGVPVFTCDLKMRSRGCRSGKPCGFGQPAGRKACRGGND